MTYRASVFIVLLFGLFAPLLSSPAFSKDKEASQPLIQIVTVGILEHDVSGLWSGFQREGGTDFNADVAFKSLYESDATSTVIPYTDLLVYPAAGVSINNRGNTSKLYGDIRFEIGTKRDTGPFFVFGIGAAVHDGKLDTRRRDRKNLGSRVLLHFPVELGIEIVEQHRISIFFDHVSNAYTANRNEGMDTLGVRYGYKF